MADDPLPPELRQHVDSLADGLLKSMTLGQAFISSGDADTASRDMLALIERIADLTTFSGFDPAQSDLAGQELRDQLVRRVLHARSLALGRPADPDELLRDWRETGKLP